jgi:RNA polymerase sigma-70 factor (ECF subfamily)
VSTPPPPESPRPAAGSLSDGELLGRLDSRDIPSLEALYDRYAGLVYGLAVRVTGSQEEAEEVVQDVFWQIWKGGARYDPARGRFTSWLFAIARSRCLDRLRARRRRSLSDSPVDETTTPASAETPEVGAYLAERRERVQRALGELPEPQKQAIELSFFRGLSHSEIADQLGEPLGTVKSRIKMAMEKLKFSLQGLGSAS